MPLNQYALLPDCGAAALVTSGGPVGWSWKRPVFTELTFPSDLIAAR